MIPPSKAADDVDLAETDWRGSLLRRVRVIVLILLGIGGVATILFGFRSESMRVLGVVVLAMFLILATVLSSSRVSDTLKSWCIIACLFVTSAGAYIVAGYLPGATLAAAYALILTALLLGRGSFVIVLCGFAVLLIGFAVLVGTGIWSGASPVEFSQSDPLNWFREGLISVFFWGSLGFSVLFVVTTIEQNLESRREALEILRKEIGIRRAAEKGRREAQEAANQAQKMETIGRLAAGIAHDFNNALLVIQGWNEIRSASDTTEQQQEATAAIAQAAEHTAQLSRQLLTFARKDVRAPKYIYLDELLDGMSKSLRHLIGTHIDTRVDVATRGLVHADESQVQQLIFNLAINARDAIVESGTIRISVRDALPAEVENFPEGVENWVVLEVEDNGPGMDTEVQKRAFEPFFTTKEPGKGTGLGLSTALGIAQQSNGHIEFVSEPGRTRFSVYLPAVDAALVSDDSGKTEAETTPLGLRTLVLEDDPLARRMIVSALRNNGNDVVACDNGDKAIMLLENDSQPFDLLCSDAIFPGEPLRKVLDSFEGHSPGARILICSGYVQEEIALRKLESGEYAFLGKPFTATRLIGKIREIIG
jgi:signal transduction histidine kinase